MSYTELSYGHRKARKTYRCEWCYERIIKDEKHLYRSYVNSGEFQCGRMHLECEQAMKATPADDLLDGWSPGDFMRPGGTK